MTRLQVGPNSRIRERHTVPTATAALPAFRARLEALSIAGSPSDGASVNSWTDTSGNGNHATTSSSPGTVAPIFKTNIVNGQPICRFTGAASGLDFPSGLLTGMSDAELTIVFKVDNDPPGAGAQSGHLIQLNGAASASHLPFTDSNIYDGWASTTRKTVGNPSASMSSQFRCYNARSATGAFEAWLDNTQLFTTASTTFTTGAASGFGNYVGHRDGSNGNVWFDGDAAAIFITAVLSSGDRTALRAYITSTYGVTF